MILLSGPQPFPLRAGRGFPFPIRYPAPAPGAICAAQRKGAIIIKDPSKHGLFDTNPFEEMRASM